MKQFLLLRKVFLHKVLAMTDLVFIPFIAFILGIVAMIVFEYLKPDKTVDFVFNRDKWERILSYFEVFITKLSNLEKMLIEVRGSFDTLERRRPPRKTINERKFR